MVSTVDSFSLMLLYIGHALVFEALLSENIGITVTQTRPKCIQTRLLYRLFIY